MSLSKITWRKKVDYKCFFLRVCDMFAYLKHVCIEYLAQQVVYPSANNLLNIPRVVNNRFFFFYYKSCRCKIKISPIAFWLFTFVFTRLCNNLKALWRHNINQSLGNFFCFFFFADDDGVKVAIWRFQHKWNEIEVWCRKDSAATNLLGSRL